MIKSGKLSYSLVIKQGKNVKVINISELIRNFGALSGVGNVVKVDSSDTPVNNTYLRDLQHKIVLLEIENGSLKGAVKARDEHIDSLRQVIQLIEYKKESSSQIKYTWWKFWGQ